jgi:hypothetical protein
MKGIFKRNKIEENVAKQLMCGCSAKKLLDYLLWVVCYFKMDMKTIEILLNLTSIFS